ncbi:MAG: hypothetical protein RL531_600 [Actinomycetota bacterium]|jgi:uncharacterized protein (DUF2252 family)
MDQVDLDRRAQHRAAGRDLRKVANRSAHGSWEPTVDRPDPIEVLHAQDAARVADLVPIRYGRMAASPFAFFRGSAAVMAADLADTPVTGIQVQACGDAHLANFGMYATPERRLVFDLNDFDETLPGPWEWDVKRLAASFEIAGRSNAYSPGVVSTAVLEVGRAYREAMLTLTRLSTLEEWYFHVDIDSVLAEIDAVRRGEDRSGSMALSLLGLEATRDRKTIERARRQIEKARRRTSERALTRLTEVGPDGSLRIIDQPPLVEPIALDDAARRRYDQAFDDYLHTLNHDRRYLLERFRFVALGRKVVGVGSVGTQALFAVYVDDGGAPLLLQFKQALASVLEPYVGPSEYPTHGERVVAGQRMMQSASDAFLGWARVADTGVDYYFRQLRDMKGSFDLAFMSPAGFVHYARLCGVTLARAHVRTGDGDAIAGYLGDGGVFDRAIASFAASYADQAERDHAALRRAIDDGRVPVAYA